MSRLAALGVFVSIASAPALAAAHEVNFGALGGDRPNLLYARGGAEYGFVAGVGYGRVFRIANRPLVLSGDLTMPIAMPDFGDYRARVGVQIPIVYKRGAVLAARVAPAVRGNDNTIARMTSLGTDTGVLAGYYAKRWFIAGEVGIDAAWTTHIEHADRYRVTQNPAAKDGWYAVTGGNVYYGLLGGYSFEFADLMLRVGQSRNLSNGKTGFLPAYATLNISFRFPDPGARRRPSSR
ncbi:MAG: hypothetical protein AAF721_12580 [Myxococcota bacterium]